MDYKIECQYCGKSIKLNAKVCKYCHRVIIVPKLKDTEFIRKVK